MSYTSKQAARESHAAEQQGAKPSAQLFSDQRTSTSAQLKQQHMMGAVQRMSAEEEEPLQGKFATLQRAEEEELLQGKFATAQLTEEEEPIQGKFDTLQRASAEEEEPLQGKFNSIAPAQLEQKPNNTGLPDNLKSGIENMSGFSMDDVKVHYNSDKPAQLNAHAYAQGTDIHVAPGQEQHLPHEAWHVVQQKQGRVQPTMQMKAGVPVNDDTGLEHEADVMGEKAKSLSPLSKDTDYKSNANENSIQLFAVPKNLNDLSTMVTTVSDDIKNSNRGDPNESLYGADQWALDTAHAAERKLDEWYLVKELLQQDPTNQASEIGFGISDTTEPDAVGYHNGNVVIAGENKLVSGKFSQINENIDSALDQLCTGTRAINYSDINLIARVNILENSEAAKHFYSMKNGNKSWLKGMETRWDKKLQNFHKQGKRSWPKTCELSLIITIGNDEIFNRYMSK